MIKSNNTLFVVSAPSGSGKTSIMRAVMGRKAEVTSFTTRQPREGEVEGQDYFFISRERFSELDALGEIVEKTQYPPDDPNGNYYGVTVEALAEKLEKGNAFVIVDTHGADQIKKLYENTVSIWIYTSKEDAIQCMIDRGDDLESPQSRSRLETFDLEQTNRTKYDYVITNQYGKMSQTMYIVSAIVGVRSIYPIIKMTKLNTYKEEK